MQVLAPSEGDRPRGASLPSGLRSRRRGQLSEAELEARRRERHEKIAAKLELARALLGREDLGADGRAAFRARFPHAPQEMTHTASFHVYVDGCEAALNFIAEAELMLRDPRSARGPDCGICWDLLYHVYNWQQFESLLPDARPTLIDLLAELKQAVADDDRAGIVGASKHFEEILEACQNPPKFDR
ncbi:hypothetical protein RAS1_01770 [Phycisphaerae bacterium RAS1]|nr:hypothetical protein RAS1_01770 [Phycisphaerae bacterium RAS1]